MCVSRPARRAKYCSVRAYAILGLAAATGFRVFVPLRVAGLTARGLGAAHRILLVGSELQEIALQPFECIARVRVPQPAQVFNAL